MSGESSLAAPRHFTQSKRFWWLLGYAIILGAFGAVAGLVFLGVTGLGEQVYGNPGNGWMQGNVWWVAVAAGAGLIVGVLRHVMHVPDKTPGIVENLENEHVDPALVPSIVAVSAVSLLGGASLGPEVALGSMGGGLGSWMAERRSFSDDAEKATTLSGIAGAFGGLFSSPLMAIILVLEIARPSRKGSGEAFYASLVSSAVSFGIYFSIAGSVFLGIYKVPRYEYQDWNLLAGVMLGLLATAIVLVVDIVVKGTAAVFERAKLPAIVRPVIGGILFGLVGVALPLTNFTGSEQLSTVLKDASTLGLALLVATLLGKMLTFALSSASGFIGGPIFPILFIGGMTGIIVNQVFPAIPLGLSFTCMLAAVPAAIVSAPFTMVLLAALLTQIGAVQTAPILIAVGTASITIAGVRYLVASRKRSTQAAAPPEQPAT